MLKNPFESPSIETAHSAEQVEREADRRFIERLDRKLGEVPKESVKLFDDDGNIVKTLFRAYVYKNDNTTRFTELVTPKTKEEIRGIRLQFSEDTGGYFGKSLYLSVTDTEIMDCCQEYKTLLEQIEGIKHRALPEDKRLKLTQQLDASRRTLHDKAASYIQRNLLDHYFERALMDKTDARKIFEVLYDIWDIPQELNGLSYSEGALDDVDLEKVKERVLQETGAKIDISYFTYGFHTDQPENQYEIIFLEHARPDIIPKVKKVITSFFTKKAS